jgi:D-threo-aldose 1-dehydrogenase
MMMPLLRNWDFDALITHNRFTLANRSANDMLDLAKSRGIAVLNAAPRQRRARQRLDRLSALRLPGSFGGTARSDPQDRSDLHAARGAAGPPRFNSRCDPRIASTICGVTKPERVKQTVNWARFPIPDEAWAELMALSHATEDPEATRDYKLG